MTSTLYQDCVSTMTSTLYQDCVSTMTSTLYQDCVSTMTSTLYQDCVSTITSILYQVPGLCVYNDQFFTEDDWEGIRKLHDSVKVKDPLKVGRFGLGFKSVFHITGL